MEDRHEGARPRFLKTKDLLLFQADDVAIAYVRDGYMFAWDTGTGKSIGAIALAKLCLLDKKVEKVLLVCERNKLREWQEDFQADTDLTVRIHHGASRWRKLEAEGLPEVLVTTYETAKRDCTIAKGRTFEPGRLLHDLEDHSVLVIFDEVAKLRNRTSANYKAHEYILRTLRRGKDTKVLGLTGTPIEKGYEDGFSELRLIVPKAMPTVKDFDARYIRYRDIYGRPTYRWENIPEFVDLVQPHIGRKRKTDPDVIDQFPPLTENYRYVEMSAPQKRFYQMVEEQIFEEADKAGGDPSIGAFMLLRQIAGHPASILRSGSAQEERSFVADLISVLGMEHVQNMPSAKTEELVSYLKPIVEDQEAKALVFTFFGQSILHELNQRLQDEKIFTFTYHGGQSAGRNEHEKQAFQHASGGAVLLASDAAARGINLPEATHVIEFESALTHAMRVQRRDRAHRLGSKYGPVTAMTFITEGTIEEQIIATVLRRNSHSDTFLGDATAEVGEEFISAADRQQMIMLAREHHKTKKRIGS